MSNKAATIDKRSRGRPIALYFALAALTLATIGGGLWALRSIEHSYADAVAEAVEWHEHLDDASVLEEALDGADAALRGAFDHREKPASLEQYDEQKLRFRGSASQVFAMLDQEAQETWRPQFATALPAIRRSLNESLKSFDHADEHARRLFAALTGQDENAAHDAFGRAAADMRVARSKLRRMHAEMRDLQAQLWRVHEQSLANGRSAEQALGLALSLIVVLLAGLGRVLQLRFRADAAALEAARAAQATQAERFRTFAETASDWMWETDPEHRFSYFSDSVRRFADPTAALGQPCYAGLVDAPRHGANAATVKGLLDRREAFRDLLTEVRLPDGSISWIVSNAEPHFGDDGAFLGYRGSSRSATETIQAQDALHKSETLYRSLADSIDGIVSRVRLGETWTVEYVSPKNEEMFGIAPAQVIGLNVKDIWRFGLHQDDVERHLSVIESAVAAGRSYEIEFRVKAPSGNYRWVLERGHVVKSEPGEVDLLDSMMIDITARKEAEFKAAQLRNELEARGTLISALANNLEGAMFRVRRSPQPAIEYISPGIKKIIGVDAESMIGKAPEALNMRHPDDYPRYLAEIASAIRERRPYESEHRLVLPDGSVRWILERGMVSSFAPDGGPEVIDGFLFDVTERRRLSEELADRERHFAALAANIDGVMFRARNGMPPIMEYYSPGIEKLVGIPASELIGKPSIGIQLTHPDDLRPYIETVTTALRERRSYEVEFRMVLPTGETRWVLERGQATAFDERGTPTIVEGFSLDITERRRLNEELKLREERLSSLAANIDGVLFRTRLGPPTIMEYYSPGIKKHIGIDAAELIGKPPIGLQFTHPDDRDRYDRVLAEALRSNTPYEIEFRFILPDGRIKWVLEAGRTTAFDAHGKPTIMEGMSIDVTARKEAEEALAAARDAAEAANKAKSEFLAMMTHEIRTPMNGVLGMTGVLIDSGLTTEQRRNAATIRDSAEGLLRIINDVLDFSKLEAGALQIEPVAFDLHALFNYAAEIVAVRANAKSVALNVKIAASTPRFVRADAGRIRQVVLNLLGNAVKFTERGSVTLEATAREAADGRIALRVCVADTGIGIAADRISRLFQSFEQADASISRRFGGTGLGLAISKKLVERMGGSIGAESEAGKGSTFWFELPVAPASEADVDATNAGSPADIHAALAVIKGLGRAPRVLVVEDNATNQLVAKSVLGQFGITPDMAGDGLEAIDAVRRTPYDVILMDVHMPEMDGFEATRAIRAMKGSAAGTPIIALTANAFAEDVERYREAGMNAHLGKPFRKEELIAALAAAIDGRGKFAPVRPHDGDDAAPIIDWDAIERFRADSGEEMFRLLIDTYVSDAAVKLDRLAKLARAGDRGREAMRLAHSLKSSSAMAGAAALSRYASAVEAKLNASEGASEDDARAMAALFGGYRQALKDRGLIAA